ncbi:MAG: hypothetical protein ACR2P8_02885, partial [Myxococcota bacterium]
MKLATFTPHPSDPDADRIGVVDGEEVLDLAAAAPNLPREMLRFIEAGAPAMLEARSALGSRAR